MCVSLEVWGGGLAACGVGRGLAEVCGKDLTTEHFIENTDFLFVFVLWKGDARTQSPTTKNCAPEFPTFGEIASFNLAECNAQVST